MIVRGHRFEPEARYGAPLATCPCGAVQIYILSNGDRSEYRYQTPPLVGRSRRRRLIPTRVCPLAGVSA